MWNKIQRSGLAENEEYFKALQKNSLIYLPKFQHLAISACNTISGYKVICAFWILFNTSLSINQHGSTDWSRLRSCEHIPSIVSSNVYKFPDNTQHIRYTDILLLYSEYCVHFGLPYEYSTYHWRSGSIDSIRSRKSIFPTIENGKKKSRKAEKQKKQLDIENGKW